MKRTYNERESYTPIEIEEHTGNFPSSAILRTNQEQRSSQLLATIEHFSGQRYADEPLVKLDMLW